MAMVFGELKPFKKTEEEERKPRAMPSRERRESKWNLGEGSGEQGVSLLFQLRQKKLAEERAKKEEEERRWREEEERRREEAAAIRTATLAALKEEGWKTEEEEDSEDIDAHGMHLRRSYPEKPTVEAEQAMRRARRRIQRKRAQTARELSPQQMHRARTAAARTVAEVAGVPAAQASPASEWKRSSDPRIGDSHMAREEQRSPSPETKRRIAEIYGELNTERRFLQRRSLGLEPAPADMALSGHKFKDKQWFGGGGTGSLSGNRQGLTKEFSRSEVNEIMAFSKVVAEGYTDAFGAKRILGEAKVATGAVSQPILSRLARNSERDLLMLADVKGSRTSSDTDQVYEIPHKGQDKNSTLFLGRAGKGRSAGVRPNTTNRQSNMDSIRALSRGDSLGVWTPPRSTGGSEATGS